MNTQTAESRRTAREFAHEVVVASGAQPTDNITIVGTEHLEILIELIRRGFAHAACGSAEYGPRAAMPPADVLIAPDVKSETDLHGVLARLGRDLRPCGVLVLSCAETSSALEERRLRRLLMEGGFASVERIAGHGDIGPLWCAHKGAASMQRAA